SAYPNDTPNEATLEWQRERAMITATVLCMAQRMTQNTPRQISKRPLEKTGAGVLFALEGYGPAHSVRMATKTNRSPRKMPGDSRGFNIFRRFRMASLARFWNYEKSVKLFRIWWTRRDSNPRPPRCERGALPAELLAHEQRGNSSKRSGACQHAFRCLQTHKDASRFPTGQDAV